MSVFKVPYAPSVKRLPTYLLIAKQALANGDEYISGTAIAVELELEAIQVRKDLGITGIAGKPKKGYPVEALINKIEEYLNWNTRQDAIVVGAGNLGSALSGFPGFKEHGLHIVAAFDVDKSKFGKIIHDTPIFSMDELNTKVKELHVQMAILTVPPQYSQELADRLVESGIKAIWNFTNTKIKLPSDVIVQNEDLSSGYAMLSTKCRVLNTLSAKNA